MNINEEFKELCKENEIPLSEGFLFGIILEFQDQIPELKQFILNEGFFDYERYQPLQINLCTTNPETLKPELKVPLFGGVVDGEYEVFITSVVEQIGSTIKGKETSYSLFTKEGIEKNCFYKVKNSIENFDLNRLVKSIVLYYGQTMMAKQLGNYLRSEECLINYKTLQEENYGRLLNKS